MRRVIGLFVVAVSVGMPAGPAVSQEDERRKEEVDYLELATTLLQNKNYDRASIILQKVNTEDEDLDRPRFHFLRGVVRLNLGEYPGAAEDFERALQREDPRPIIWVYLGQAYFQAEKYEKSLEAFAQAKEEAREIPSTFAMRAQAHWRLEHYEEAWSTLNGGLALHPDYDELLRRKIFFAVKRNLFRTAAFLGRAYIRQAEVGVRDYLAIADALYQSESPDEALRFLELAHLRFPDEAAPILQLARVYRDEEKELAAASLVERAALRSSSDELLVQAGELYRKAGMPLHAMALNARVGKSELRLRQRLSLLVDLKAYELVAAMERDLERVGLLDDDDIRYALAYSFFESRDFDRARKLLAGIEDAETFRKAVELRKAMADCQEEPWRC